MVGYKLGVLFLQRSLEDLHNSERNGKKLKNFGEKYTKEDPKNSHYE